MDFHDGHFVQAQHRIVVEVPLFHPPVLEGDLTVKRRGEAEDDAAFHLRADGVRVYHRTAVDRADNPMDSDLTLLGNRDFRHLSHEAAERGVHGQAAPVPCG